MFVGFPFRLRDRKWKPEPVRVIIHLYRTRLPLLSTKTPSFGAREDTSPARGMWKQRFVTEIPRADVWRPDRTALGDMRAGHVTHCSEALNDTPPGERVCNAAVSWDDPTGSVIWDQSSIHTLPEVHYVIYPPKTPPVLCTLKPLLCYKGNLNLLNNNLSTMVEDICVQPLNLEVPPCSTVQRPCRLSEQSIWAVFLKVKLWDEVGAVNRWPCQL